MRFHIGVGVPVVGGSLVDQFDESHAAFSQAAGHDALPGEALGASALQAVELKRGVGLLRKVEDLGHFALHAVGGFEGTDASCKGRVGLARQLMFSIQAGEQAELQVFDWLGGRAAREIRNRVRAGGD